MSFRAWRLAGLVTVALVGCANRGMQAPGEPDSGLGTGGIEASGGRGGSGTGGTGTGGAAGSPVGSGGHGGTAGTPGTGGTAGAGGAHTTGTGGTTPGTGGTTPGTGGTTPGTGGAGGIATGTGGTTTGGTTGTGGTATGGVAGTGGAAGKGGAAGSPATGGTTGTGGSAGAGGGAAGAGGSAGGAAGSGAYTCPLGGTLDCSTAGALKVPGGLVTDFSAPQWNATTNQFCDADGLRGRLFSFVGTAATDASTVTVDTTNQNLKLAVTAKDYVGGGLIFESCVNASAFTSVQFTARLASGSLTGCTWQVQLQTQEQRRAADTDPTGGTCTATTCYAYPLVANLTAPGATATAYTEALSAFTPASTVAPTPTQVVGIQWQVTSSSGAGCTAELRIDNVKFQ